MTCAVCGKGVRKSPVWVVLGDKGERAPKETFSLHEKCYPPGGKVTVQEPSYTDDDGVLHEGAEYETTRYVKVKAPNG